MSLTKRSVDAAQPRPGPDGQPRRTIYFDGALPGFGLLVTPAGSKSFVAQYRAGRGRAAPTRRVTIGPLGTWTPELARAEAKRILGEAAHGKDPAQERADRRRGGGKDLTVQAVIAEWLKRDQAKNRSHAAVERIMEREVIPALGKRPIAAIRKRDLIALVEAVADRGAPAMANRVLAHAKRLFKWAAGRDLIESDPAAHVARPAPEAKRDRVLAEAELRAVWHAADPATGYGAIVRLLVLLGQRREEVGGIGWSEVDLERALWRLPGARAKNGQEHEVPLPRQAVAVLAGRTRLEGRDLVFGAGAGPFWGWSQAKKRLDATIARHRAEERLGRPLGDGEASAAGDALPPWVLHDLRRTLATGMNEIGVAPHVVEAVLNHVGGHKAGVAGVYNRAKYREEKRAALQRWADHVERIVAGAGATAEVVPLRRA
jgi:integrase